MRYLFVHQSFCAQYLHLLQHLRSQRQHDLVFITASQRRAMPGVRQVLYNPPEPTPAGVHPFLREFEYALRRADAVAHVAQSLKDLGYVPDIIIGHHGWGEMLGLGDVYPGVPILGYFEFFYRTIGQDVNFDPEFPSATGLPAFVRMKNAVNLQALTLPGWGQTPTLFQRHTYPGWAQEKISLLYEGVDLSFCRPDKTVFQRPVEIGDVRVEPHEKLVTYASRDLEPYRGFHSFMRALPDILKGRSDTRVIIAGNDGVSYGNPPPEEKGKTWREVMLAELEGKLDLSRIHFVGWLQHHMLVRLFQRSNAHVYLTYPFVLSWSLREAMAVGCPLVVSDTAPLREFLKDGRTARFVPFLRPSVIAEGVLEMLDNPPLAVHLGHEAHLYAQEKLGLKDYLERYERLVGAVMQQR